MTPDVRLLGPTRTHAVEIVAEMNPALPLGVAAALFLLLAGFCGWWRGPRARAAGQRNARQSQQISVLRAQVFDV
jgi:hypothetical protein